MRRLSELGGKRIPFLRWSVLRMIVGARYLVEHETHVEYQSLLKDLVLESDYLGR